MSRRRSGSCCSEFALECSGAWRSRPRLECFFSRGSFCLLHLVWLFPWSFYLITLFSPSTLKEAVARRFGSSILPVAWALTILLFFSFSTRLEYYTLPALPALALLAGKQCASLWEKGG